MLKKHGKYPILKISKISKLENIGYISDISPICIVPTLIFTYLCCCASLFHSQWCSRFIGYRVANNAASIQQAAAARSRYSACKHAGWCVPAPAACCSWETATGGGTFWPVLCRCTARQRSAEGWDGRQEFYTGNHWHDPSDDATFSLLYSSLPRIMATGVHRRQVQGGHKPGKPGILRDFSEHGKLIDQWSEA